MKWVINGMLLFLALVSGENIYAQKQGQAFIDSLLREIPKQKEDTNKVILLHRLSDAYKFTDPGSGIKYGEQNMELATKLGWKKGIAAINSDIANNYQSKAAYAKATDYFSRSLHGYEEIGDKDGAAGAKGSIGTTYFLQADYDKGLEYLLDALKITEEIGDKKYTALFSGNTANIYSVKGDNHKADEYYFKALKIYEELGNKQGMETISGGIANSFQIQARLPEALEYYGKAMKLSEELVNKIHFAAFNNNIGTLYKEQGNYPKAFEYFFKALKVEEETSNKSGACMSLGNIGGLYDKQGDYTMALEYLFKALSASEETGSKRDVAIQLGNIGNTYAEQKDFPKALEYYNKSLKIREELGLKRGIAWTNNNIGSIYQEQGVYDSALEYYTKALKTNEMIGNKYDAAQVCCNIGTLHLRLITDTAAGRKSQQIRSESAGSGNGNQYLQTTMEDYLHTAFEFFNRGLKTSKENSFLNVEQSIYDGLSEAYKLSGKYDSALIAYEESTKLKDSIFNKENEKKIGKLEAKAEFDRREDSLKSENEKKELTLKKEMELNALKYEYEKKQAAAKTEKERQQLKYEQQLKEQKIESDYAQKSAEAEAIQRQKELERKQKDALAKAAQDKKDALAVKELQKQKLVRNSFMGGFAVVLLFAGIFFNQRNKIKDGKKKSDELLLNILPTEVAEELKAKGSAEAKMIDEVTVLFTDFKGFTQLSEKLSPKELVAEINECFSAFDLIMEKYGVEKIKTIGDSYMAAGGLPTTNKTHPEDVVSAALDIQKYMADHKAKKEAAGELYFEIRIGIHSGPVVAGIVGVKKFQYDIWGDTVNTASRMESSGAVGKVNVSGTTYELVKDKFTCEYRGEIEAKHKGMLKMYFVVPLSPRAERSI